MPIVLHFVLELADRPQGHPSPFAHTPSPPSSLRESGFGVILRIIGQYPPHQAVAGRRSAGWCLLALLLGLSPARVTAGTGIITTVAGTGSGTYNGDGIAATTAGVEPAAVFVDAAGRLYISEFYGQRIRRVDPTTGLISTVAGTGTKGYNGDGIAATSADLDNPTAIFVDGSGNIYFAEASSNRVRRVDAGTGFISTVAGTGTAGYNGDAISATVANLSYPSGLFLDQSGNMFIADNGAGRIRRVDANAGLISTVAGTGVGGYNGDGIAATTAQLSNVDQICLDASGNLYIADSSNYRVRKVDAASGLITTVAGSGTRGYNGDGIPATSADLEWTTGAWVDRCGNLYIADNNNSWRVRKVDATTGLISTVAGTGVNGFNGDGISATAANLSELGNVVTDSAGVLYIADHFDYRVRRVDLTCAPLTPALAWERTYNSAGSNDDVANAVAVDSSGNAVVVGWEDRTDLGQGRNWAIRRYNTQGDLLWFRDYDDPLHGDEFARGVAVDSSGHVLAAGIQDPYLQTNTLSDWLVRRYDPDGVLLWSRTENGPVNGPPWGNDNGFAVASDLSGSVYVVGDFASPTGSGADLCIRKYAEDGTPIWTRTGTRTGARDNGIALGAAVAPTGEIVVVGEQTCCWPSMQGDWVAEKLSSGGAVLWSTVYTGSPSGWDSGTGVVVDGDGNLIVCGREVAPGEGMNGVVLKYSPAGDLLWRRSRNSPGNYDDQYRGVAVDGEGDVIAVGFEGAAGGQTHWMISVFNPRGNALWTWTGSGEGPTDLTNPNAGRYIDVAVDGSGFVVAGTEAVAGQGLNWSIRKFTFGASSGPGAGPGSGPGGPAPTVAVRHLVIAPNRRIRLPSQDVSRWTANCTYIGT